MQDVRRSRTIDWVNATVIENLWAGFGFSVISFVGGYAWRGYDQSLIVVSFLFGSAFFGALCVIRFTADERGIVMDLNARRVMENMVLDAQAETKRLEVENAELRRENNRLARQVRTSDYNKASAQAKTIVAAADDPLEKNVRDIVKRWSAGAKFGRDDCNMSRKQWETATQFLIHCGVMEVTNDSRKQRVFADLNQSQVERKINNAFDKIARHENTNYTPALS